MEEQFAEMDRLLYSWNLPQLSATFREQEITPEALDALSSADIEILIPKLGPRALFRKRLQEWLQTSQNCNEDNGDVQAVDQIVESLTDEQQMTYSYVDEDENEVEVLSEVWLSDDGFDVKTKSQEQVNSIVVLDQDKNYGRDCQKSDIDEIAKNVFLDDQKPNLPNLETTEESQRHNEITNRAKRCKRVEDYKNLTRSQILERKSTLDKFDNIKQEASQNKTSQESVDENLELEKQQEGVAVNEDQYLTGANTTQRRWKRIGHNWSGLKVEELLLSTEAGRSLIENYESNPVLDKRARSYLAELIVTETFAKNLIMDRYKFDNIADQIVQLFPTEEKKSWYSSKKCSGGTLYYKYYATYTKMRKNGFYQHYVDSVSKNLDTDASLSEEIENSNYSVKLDDISDNPDKDAFKRSIPRYERIRNSSDFERIDVKEILEKTYEGLGIIDFYEKNSSLDVTTRNRLCKLVCTEGINRGIKMQPCDFYDISCQVVELFPNEKHEVYFFPRGKTPPKGCLYHKYIYLMRRMKKMGLLNKVPESLDFR